MGAKYLVARSFTPRGFIMKKYCRLSAALFAVAVALSMATYGAEVSAQCCNAYSAPVVQPTGCCGCQTQVYSQPMAVQVCPTYSVPQCCPAPVVHCPCQRCGQDPCRVRGTQNVFGRALCIAKCHVNHAGDPAAIGCCIDHCPSMYRFRLFRNSCPPVPRRSRGRFFLRRGCR
ncbi:MAG: hypothetical protein ACI87E_003111 [Mariniblastus sp.]